MLTILFWAVLFFIAGFIMEAMVSFYHKSRENNQILICSIYSTLITIITVLVSTRIVFSVTNSPLGHWSLIYVVIFAIGKGIGTYLGLHIWDWMHQKPKSPVPPP